MPRSMWPGPAAPKVALASLVSAVSLLLAPLAYAEPSAGPVHVVAPGETLLQIADAAGVDGAALASLNGLDDANQLSVGQSLKLPGKPAAASSAGGPSTGVPAAGSGSAGSATSGPRTYTVVDGDTLSSIAQQLSTTTVALVEANTLSDADHLVVGTQLVVPAGSSAAPAASTTTAPGAAAPASAAPVASPSVPSAVGAPAPAAASSGQGLAPSAGPVATAALKAKPTAPVAIVSPPPGAPSGGFIGAALKLLGSAYVWGGSGPANFDCSGFVWYVARQVGKSLSRGMVGEYNAGVHPGRDELKPGDLVFFQNTYSAGLSHTGIYIGNGQFVHAADEAAGVTISSLSTTYWSGHWFGATRLP